MWYKINITFVCKMTHCINTVILFLLLLFYFFLLYFNLVVDKKRGNKMRLTIRKFLRLGSRDEHLSGELLSPPLPPVRQRPEIIHPLDVNKSGVQVVRNSGSQVHSERVSSKW